MDRTDRVKRLIAPKATRIPGATSTFPSGGGYAEPVVRTSGVAGTVSVVVPIRTVSEANVRSFWAARARRVKAQRWAVAALLRGFRPLPALPAVVTLKRVAPSSGLDGDNLQSALKATRDAVAEVLGVDDRDPRVVWVYEQRRGKPKEWAVEIQITHST